MEFFATYILRSVVWITGFALVFFLFLRNERFFVLKRIYLIGGIIAAFIGPLVTVRYMVDVDPAGVLHPAAAVMNPPEVSDTSEFAFTSVVLLIVWLSGLLFMLLRTAIRSWFVYRAIRSSGFSEAGSARLVRLDGHDGSFSFFSYVIVNPSLNDIEAKEIINHEMTHVSQKHWLDLIMIELLCVIQWFNPVVWFYRGFIMQNHEYLADEGALQRTSDPAVYRAALLNQITGLPVFSLTNAFNYSLNKKRFLMMKNTKSSPYRKLKILLVLPVLAVIMVSFARPEYRHTDRSSGSGSDNITLYSVKDVKGVILDENGKPLQGAVIVIRGTTTGTLTDVNGKFSLTGVADDAMLVISYVGYESKVMKPDFSAVMAVKMVRALIEKDTVQMAPPPPPPPPPSFDIRGDGSGAYIIIDGVAFEGDLNTIDPSTIESINVFKDNEAIKRYGEKGRNGVISITTKKEAQKTVVEKVKDTKEPAVSAPAENARERFVIVEEMPSFPGGDEAMMAWIAGNLKYPAEALKNKIEGVVIVRFAVSETGKVKDAQVVRSSDPLLDAEALRIVNGMPDWKPGRQSGKPVEVWYSLPVKFKPEVLKK